MEDPRAPRGVRHKLSETLLIIIGALLSGAKNAEDIADWGWDHYEWLS